MYIIHKTEVVPIANCPSCKNSPFDGDLYCRKCGEEVPLTDTYECPECNADVLEADNFCYSCGTRFEGCEDAGDDGTDTHPDDDASEEEQGG